MHWDVTLRVAVGTPDDVPKKWTWTAATKNIKEYEKKKKQK